MVAKQFDHAYKITFIGLPCQSLCYRLRVTTRSANQMHHLQFYRIYAKNYRTSYNYTSILVNSYFLYQFFQGLDIAIRSETTFEYRKIEKS